jgi:hypothetical protein
VAFALPDVIRRPFLKAKGGVAAAKSGTPTLGHSAPATLPAGGAKALVERTCGTACHSMEVVTSQRLSTKDWNAVVQSMVARGALASDPEVKAIVGYLAKTFGAREK